MSSQEHKWSHQCTFQANVPYMYIHQIDNAVIWDYFFPTNRKF